MVPAFFFCVLLFSIYFFLAKFVFLSFFLVFATRLSGVLFLSPTACFIVIRCVFLCLYLGA